jgi:hypothetical protein
VEVRYLDDDLSEALEQETATSEVRTRLKPVEHFADQLALV